MCKALMKKITELSFAMDDIRLFLDTHPNCTDALQTYNELQVQRAAAVAEYEAQYGALSFYGPENCNTFTRAVTPWPWQN